jgi:hypothetical protein
LQEDYAHSLTQVVPFSEMESVLSDKNIFSPSILVILLERIAPPLFKKDVLHFVLDTSVDFHIRCGVISMIDEVLDFTNEEEFLLNNSIEI